MTNFLKLLFLSFLIPVKSWAFVEMVRHGYTNCIACHISPSGGGALTSYGKLLSKELLSTWGTNRELRTLYYFRNPKWLITGGNFRGLSLQTKRAGDSTRSKYYNMQNDVEIGYKKKQFAAVATLGTREPTTNNSSRFISRRHYLLYKFENPENIIRIGRFFPAFGLYIPEHNTVIRKGLVWDQEMETYNLEFSHLGEKWNFQGTAIAGRPDAPNLYREQGASTSFSYNYGDSNKIGGSYYYGKSDAVSHHITGPFAVFGLSSKFFLLWQTNVIRTYSSTGAEPYWGHVNYEKLSYEFIQGLHAYLTLETSQSDHSQKFTRAEVYGTGLQFFPRPHWEFQAFYQKRYSANRFAADTYALYWHFYL